MAHQFRSTGFQVDPLPGRGDANSGDGADVVLPETVVVPAPETPPPPEFHPGGDNVDFFEFTFDRESVLDMFSGMFPKEIATQLAAQGFDQEFGLVIFNEAWRDFGTGFLDPFLQKAGRLRSTLLAQLGPNVVNGLDPSLESLGENWYLGTAEGLQELTNAAWEWFRGRIPYLGDRGAFDEPPSRRGGRRRLTAAEIRNQFDVDELANAATAMWRTWLLDEPDNARAMAKAYIEAIVETRGEKEIDFKTFIRKRAEKTSRWASIYSNKPEHVGVEEYLQPYVQAANQVLRPENVDEVAIGGAQFGASSSAFAGRLRRTDEVTSSAPFINEIQNRMRDLRGVLKG